MSLSLLTWINLCNCRIRRLAKFLLKYTLFFIIFILEIFLQSSLFICMLAIAFWGLILIIFTSILWVPLLLVWSPALIITVALFKFTSVIFSYLNMNADWTYYRRERNFSIFVIKWSDTSYIIRHGLERWFGALSITFYLGKHSPINF